MRIGIDGALGVATDALSLRSQRTQLIANNIANADTPGFKARDIDFQQLLAKQVGQSGSINLQATHQQHLGGTGANANAADDAKYRVPLMPSLDGNSVDTQLEQSAFAENSIQFLTNLRILNGRLQGMMTAIKGE